MIYEREETKYDTNVQMNKIIKRTIEALNLNVIEYGHNSSGVIKFRVIVDPDKFDQMGARSYATNFKRILLRTMRDLMDSYKEYRDAKLCIDLRGYPDSTLVKYTIYVKFKIISDDDPDNVGYIL